MPAALHTFKPRPAFLQPVVEHAASPRFIPIPQPQPVTCTLPLTAVLGADAVQQIATAGTIVFHSVGDTGGIYGTGVQDAVAEAMEAQVAAGAAAPIPTFFYHLGDVVYFNGQSADYPQQFYEPYKYYQPPIMAIAGNHDGETRVQPGDPPDTDPSSLYGFFQNFCDTQRRPIDSYRDTMTQPYVYWTLQAPFVTIIGLYSNVEGLLDGAGTVAQQQWLTVQLRNADQSTCIIIAVHHPPYSLDKAHGGYPAILSVLDQAAQDAGVWPHAVLSGHVHDYQRFTRAVPSAGGKQQVPYVVAGAGGYANTATLIHKLRRDPAHPSTPVPCPAQLPAPYDDVSLRGYCENAAGFLRVTVEAKQLLIEYFSVPLAGGPGTLFDSVTLDYTTRAVTNEMNPGTTGAA
jgi:hypothetical protein